ncbi:8-amino-7-oxononanoate synthase [Pseudocercospora fuligena]|uniref:8-amino-7-oxononanoate synthase n=1 Tax=Pseudocercospora fuligena TaxID=685502 RepID=A0A8H6RN94_9PEZI|nr:8-amino-7-oxononanoate synthase [Pseudocercospora fuligena]
MTSNVWGQWAASQKPRGPTMREAAVFYRNLEEALDVRRRDNGLYVPMKNTWIEGLSIDFCSNDSLSFGGSGRLRKAFDEEMGQNPQVQLGSCGSRLLEGNYRYIESVEEEIARYHGVEAALIVGSGAISNYAVLEAVPRPGDAIIYDELVHGSIVDGIARSLAGTRVSFAHNDVEAFRDALIQVQDSQPLIKQGKKCALIVVESFYSMDGDMAPLRELVQAAKEVFPRGNAQFVVDEAHSMGVVGEGGRGFVAALKLDSEIAIRTQTFSKAFGSIGGCILCNHTVKTAVMNFSRSVIFTAARPLQEIAAIRAGYKLMAQVETDEGRANIQCMVKRFFAAAEAHPVLQEAERSGVMSVPLAEDWQDRAFQTQLIFVWTREHYGRYLCFHLAEKSISAFAVTFPVVPKGSSRVRIVVHANQTAAQIDALVLHISEWAQEMIQIEKTGPVSGYESLPWAARKILCTE